jgi:hypothetical protein
MKRAFLVVLLLPISWACGSATPPPAEAKTAPGGSKDQTKWPADDHSMCDWHNKPELEVSETAGPGAIRPNIRRVYKTMGDGENRHRTLICREVDTNLDGIKDTVRTFNAKGEAQHEESDSNYDGKVDHWLSFTAGSMIEEDIDTVGDGKPHLWKYYLNGALSRIKRDRTGDGKPDVWEIYTKGRLERMGVDETGDGHVDRWDRDEILRQQQEAEEAAKLAAAQGDAGAPSTAVDAGKTDGGAKKATRHESR